MWWIIAIDCHVQDWFSYTFPFSEAGILQQEKEKLQELKNASNSELSLQLSKLLEEHRQQSGTLPIANIRNIIIAVLTLLRTDSWKAEIAELNEELKKVIRARFFSISNRYYLEGRCYVIISGSIKADCREARGRSERAESIICQRVRLKGCLHCTPQEPIGNIFTIKDNGLRAHVIII